MQGLCMTLLAPRSNLRGIWHERATCRSPVPEQVSLSIGCQTCHECAVLGAADERRIGLQQPPQLTPGPRPARA